MQFGIDSVQIVFTGGSDMVSRAIQRVDFSLTPGDRRRVPSGINHVAWRFRFSDGRDFLYESHFKPGVTITPISHLDAAIEAGRVLRVDCFDLATTPADRDRLWYACEQLHGSGYDARMIVGYYAWMRLTRRRAPKLLRWFNRADHYTCNEFLVITGRDVISTLRDTDETYTPAMLYRLCFGVWPVRETVQPRETSREGVLWPTAANLLPGVA